ncbi:MAG: hypothetical protein QOD73_2381 [Solirubrobacteraceae bacterium]|nr:hypothetical protein [Solirubrobacteraceae bacterium]
MTTVVAGLLDRAGCPAPPVDYPTHGMTIGTSLFLIAVGAVLRFAVTAHLQGIDLQTVGVILMVVGIAGLLIGLYLLIRGRSPGVPPPPDVP